MLHFLHAVPLWVYVPLALLGLIPLYKTIKWLIMTIRQIFLIMSLSAKLTKIFRGHLPNLRQLLADLKQIAENAKQDPMTRLVEFIRRLTPWFFTTIGSIRHGSFGLERLSKAADHLESLLYWLPYFIFRQGSGWFPTSRFIRNLHHVMYYPSAYSDLVPKKSSDKWSPDVNITVGVEPEKISDWNVWLITGCSHEFHGPIGRIRTNYYGNDAIRIANDHASRLMNNLIEWLEKVVNLSDK